MNLTLDTRGKSCPMPIVLLARQARELAGGAQLTVLADDRAFPPDVEAWCRKTGHELLALRDLGDFFEAQIQLV